MIFSNMEYPGKNYRVQVYDAWLGEEFEPMDNPKDGDKIVYRIIGENGQPVEQKTEIYQNGAWVEQGGGGADIDNPYALLYDGTITTGEHTWQSIPVTMDIVSPLLFPNIDVNYPSTVDVKFQGVLYQNIPIKTDEALEFVYYGATLLDNTTFTFNWSEYPFAFGFNPSEELIMFCTENVGEYAVKIGSSDYMACVPTGHRTLNFNDTYFTSRYKYVVVNVT